VVTPDELTMQKYWPAHDAVAKLRHEAAISDIVRSITDRLDKMERSSAAAARACMGSARDDGSLGSGLPRLYDRLQ
jgi:hypothetical protein